MRETFQTKTHQGGAMTDEIRHNRFEVLHANITRRTNGNIIFREQMESALVSLGGFSIRHVPTIMKAILKKKRTAILAYYPLFRANLLGSYPDKDIDQLWESIVLSPALVEAGALCNHLAHGEGHSSDCAVCYAIQNKFPAHPAVQLSDGPGSLEQKTRTLNIDVVLGLLQRFKAEEKILADSNVIVIDSIDDIPPDALMKALDSLPSDIGGFPGAFADFRAKGEPISAAGKAALEKTYLKPGTDLAKSYEEVMKAGATIRFMPLDAGKSGSLNGRVHVVKAGDILKRKGIELSIKEIPPDTVNTIYLQHYGKLPGCTCRDGEDHELCPVCHEHSMRGMNYLRDQAVKDGVTIVTAQQNVATQITDKDRWLLDNTDTKDDAEWMKRYDDGMRSGTPIEDYDLHYRSDGDRLMHMIPPKNLKKVADLVEVDEEEPLLGVPAPNIVADLTGPDGEDACIVNGRKTVKHLVRAAEVGGPYPEDDLPQKESVEPEVCKCNIWAGCTCGVMARERERKKDDELKW
jgi:hypothetical protein